jgi:predicted PurR-regulated permease PerM
MKFDILKTRRGKLSEKLNNEIQKPKPNIENVLRIIDDYEKNNLETIDKLKKEKLFETKRISGALKQTINAHSNITKELIGSATKRIMGALKSNDLTQSQKICKKISSIYHTFINIIIFIIKLEFMKTNKDKISVTISNKNNELLNNLSINKSKLIDKLLDNYFKKID